MFWKARWTILGVSFSVVLGLTSAAEASHRFFYCRDSVAYYCVQPARPAPGCYVVCDSPSVRSIDGYPTIASATADSKIAGAAPTLATTNISADPCCESAPSSSSDCPNPPEFVGGCNCTTTGPPTPISGQKGKLKVVCEKSTFYQATGTIEGTIPVPQLCVTETETFSFRPVSLNYPCNQADTSDTDCNDCDSTKCKDDCVVKGCEVYQRNENCRWKCIKCPRPAAF